MTLQDLFEQIGNNPTLVLGYFIGLPLCAFIISMAIGKTPSKGNWLYLYSAIIYMVCIPGIFAATLCAYTFLFERTSFLRVNFLIYFLPILSMIATFVIITKKVDLAYIPGFNKLSGLIFMIAATFIVMLVIEKTRVLVFLHGSIWTLVGLFAVLFLVFKFGWDRLIKPK